MDREENERRIEKTRPMEQRMNDGSKRPGQWSSKSPLQGATLPVRDITGCSAIAKPVLYTARSQQDPLPTKPVANKTRSCRFVSLSSRVVSLSSRLCVSWFLSLALLVPASVSRHTCYGC